MAARTLGAIRDPLALDDLVRAGKDADPDARPPPSTRWAVFVPSSRSSAQVRFPTQRTGVSNPPTAHSGPEETTGFILPSS